MFCNLLLSLMMTTSPLTAAASSAPSMCTKTDLDFIEFVDGNKMCGTLLQAPPLNYQFGRVEFDPNRIVEVRFLGDQRMSYTTQEGLKYTAQATANSQVLFQSGNELFRVPVGDDQIKLIVLNKKPSTAFLDRSTLFALTFKNGDQLPVKIETASLKFSDQERVQRLTPSQIDSIHIKGRIKVAYQAGGKSERLRLQNLSEKFISVLIPENHHSVILPWEQILRLSKIHPELIEIKEQEALQHAALEEIRPDVFDRLENFSFDTRLKLAQEPPAKYHFHVAQHDFSTIDYSQGQDRDLKDWIIVQEAAGFGLALGEDFEFKELTAEDEEETPNSKIEFSKAWKWNDMDLIALSNESLNVLEAAKQRVEAQRSNSQKAVKVNQFIRTVNMDSLHERQVLAKNRYATTLVPTQNQPTLIAYIPGFEIDVEPVTNQDYFAFVAAGDHIPPKEWEGGLIHHENAREPVKSIAFKEAQAYAEWKGKRLPSEWELERAYQMGIKTARRPEFVREQVDESEKRLPYCFRCISSR